MKPIRHLVLVWATVIAMSIASTAQSVFINEFTYDYEGPETKEFIEIFGPAGTDLTDWTITLYNGINGTPYHSETLAKDSGIKQACTLEDNKYGVFMLPLEGDMLKNDIPVGIALANPQKEVQHFISYEGHVFAKEGLAEGLTSQDVGVSQNDDVDMETTIQLNGTWQLKKGSPEVCNEKQQPSLPLDCHIAIEALDCTGEKVRLSVAGQFETYQWSTGQTSTTIEVGVGDYTVDVSTKAGEKCQSTISVKALTVLSCEIKPIHPSCEGEKDGELHVTSEGGSGHVEYSLDGENFQVSNVFTDLAAGDYTIIVRDRNGLNCTTKCQVTLENTTIFDIAIGLSPASCQGAATGQLEVKVSGGTPKYTYSLNGGDFQDENIFAELVAGTYTITVLDANGCSGSETVELTSGDSDLTLKLLETEEASDLETADGTALIEVVAGKAPYVLSWTGPVEGSLNMAQAGSQLIKDLKAGLYRFEVRDEQQCVEVLDVIVKMRPPYVCLGGCVTIGYVYPGDNICYKWIGEESFFNSTAHQQEVCPTVPTTYTRVITNGADILLEEDFFVDVVEPTVSISPQPAYFCEGESLTLDAGMFTSYEWQPNEETTQMITVTQAGNYEVTVKDAFDCEWTTDVDVEELSLSVEIYTESTILCPGEEKILTTNYGGTAFTIEWSNNTTNDNLSITETGTYTVTVTDDETGCQGTGTITITNGTAPPVTIQASATTICSGESVELNVQGGEDYLWIATETNDIEEIDVTKETIVVAPTETQTYTVIGVNQDGCETEASIEVVVQEGLNTSLVALSDMPICTGEAIELTVEGEGDTFEWSTDEPENTRTIEVSPNETTVYMVQVTQGTACQSTHEIVVEVHPALEVNISPSTDDICGFPMEIEVEEGYLSYDWSIADLEGDHILEVPSAGIYSVTVTDDNNCQAIAEINLQEESTDAIQAKFESDGFYAIPIVLNDTDPDNAPSNSCSTDCEDMNGFCVLDSTTDLEITSINGIQNTSNLSLAKMVVDNLVFFKENQDYENANVYITQNSSFCDSECEDWFSNLKATFEASELAYWFHLFDAPNGEDDILYVLANLPATEEHSPVSTEIKDFLASTLAEVFENPTTYNTQNFGAKSEQIIFTLQNVLLYDLSTYASPDEADALEVRSEDDPCFTISEDIICVAPSGQPIPIEMGTRLEFYQSSYLKTITDERTLINFVTEDGKKKWKSCYPKNEPNFHAGYKLLDDKAFYSFEEVTPEPGMTTVDVILGHFEEHDTEQNQENCIYLFEYPYQANAVTYQSSSKGDMIPDINSFITGDYPDDILFQLCLPKLREDELEVLQTETARFNPYENNGFLMYIAAQDIYIYSYFGSENPDEATYFYWHRLLCRWVYLPVAPAKAIENTHFLNALFGAMVEQGHTSLDILGMIPVFGEGADALNGVWYLYEGNYTEAALSLTSTIPLIGTTTVGGKLIVKFTETAANGVTVVRKVHHSFKKLGRFKCGPNFQASIGDFRYLCDPADFQAISAEKIYAAAQSLNFTPSQCKRLLDDILTDTDFLEALKDHSNPVAMVGAWKRLYKTNSPASLSLRKNTNILNWFAERGNNLPSSIENNLFSAIGNKNVLEVAINPSMNNLNIQISRGSKSNSVVSILKTADNHTTLMGAYKVHKYRQTYKKGANSSYSTIPEGPSKLAPDYTGTTHLHADSRMFAIEIEMQGTRSMDYTAAKNKLLMLNSNFDGNTSSYTWHHLDDIKYNASTGKYTCTMQLVKTSVHSASGMRHSGSVAQHKQITGLEYP